MLLHIVKALTVNVNVRLIIQAYGQTATRYGLKEIYRNELKDLLTKETRGENVSPVYLATYYTLLGQKEKAFKYLEKAYGERNAEIVLITSSRQFAMLRSDPRFADLLKRIGLPE